MDQKLFCENCGAEISATAKFCMRCGTKVVLAEREVPVSAKAEETMTVTETEAETSVPKEPEEKRERKPFFAPGEWRKFARCGAGFLLSILILVFAFLPIVSYKVDEDLIEDFSYSYSATDYIVFLYDSFLEYDEDELEESALYEKYEDLQEDLQDIIEEEDDLEDLDKSQKKLLRRYYVYTTRLLLRSKGEVSVSVAVAAAVSLAYLIFSVVFFAVASYNLVRCFLRKKEGYTKIVKMISFTPFLAILVFFATKIAKIHAYSYVQPVESAMGSGAKGIIIVSCVGILLAIAERVISNWKKISVKRMTVNAISVVLATVTICLIFSPVLSASVRAVFDGKSTKRDVTVTLGAESLLAVEMPKESLNERLDDIGSSKSEKKDYLGSEMELFSYYTLREMRAGDADGEMATFLGDTFLAFIGEYATFIVITPYVILAAALFMALAAQKSLAYLCLGESKSGKGAFVGWYLFVLAAIILLVVYIVCINSRMESLKLYSTHGGVKAGIAVNFIVCAVLGICTNISRFFDKEKANKKRY